MAPHCARAPVPGGYARRYGTCTARSKLGVMPRPVIATLRVVGGVEDVGDDADGGVNVELNAAVVGLGGNVDGGIGDGGVQVSVSAGGEEGAEVGAVDGEGKVGAGRGVEVVVGDQRGGAGISVAVATGHAETDEGDDDEE